VVFFFLRSAALFDAFVVVAPKGRQVLIWGHPKSTFTHSFPISSGLEVRLKKKKLFILIDIFMLDCLKSGAEEGMYMLSGQPRCHGFFV
jgi:hypothetical protein